MDSFREFMENSQYLEGGASTSSLPRQMGKNLKNDGLLLDQKITKNTKDDIEFRTGTNQPFKKLEVIVKAHDEGLKAHDKLLNDVYAKRFKRDEDEIKKNKEMLNGHTQLLQKNGDRLAKLEEEVADQTEAIGQIVVLIKQLSGSE